MNDHTEILDSLLQWGHDLSAVETRNFYNRLPTPNPASMGPRPFSRGNPKEGYSRLRSYRLQWGHDLSAVETSIPSTPGPRPTELQWGHDLSAVETCTAGHGRDSRSRWLQWGHDLSAVETATSGSCSTSIGSSFNGATTFQPWKPGAHRARQAAP